jgi:uncharacterized membrane protein YdjX (TVP38/TMEM64 family)
MSARVPLGSGANSQTRVFIDLTEDSDKDGSVSIHSHFQRFSPFLPYHFMSLFFVSLCQELVTSFLLVWSISRFKDFSMFAYSFPGGVSGLCL